MILRTSCIAALAAAVVVLSERAAAQVTLLVSVSSSEEQQNQSNYISAISADGRYVAFESEASNLVAGDTNGSMDFFVRDRVLGTTERVSVSSSGQQSDSTATGFLPRFLSMSPDGRFVTFTTDATNLAVGDTNGTWDVYIRDRQLGITERVSVDSNEVGGNGQCWESATSADGRTIAFRSAATNLVPNDVNGWTDIFVRDRLAGTTERVSIRSDGLPANSNNQNVSISADGRYVAFQSYATNIVFGDTNGFPDIFVRDRVAGTTTRVSLGLGGAQADSSCLMGSISADGRFVAFESSASNLVAGDTNGVWDVFVVDRQTGTTERVSVTTAGTQTFDGSYPIQYPAPSLSADGRFVAFTSESPALVPGDNNNVLDVFLRDRTLGTTQRVSVGDEGAEANSLSLYPSVAGGGRYVSFCSAASNLAVDTNNKTDIFVRDLAPEGFESSCDAGVDGVIACPCANPPSALGRGCDNSSATGGAVLAASGVAYLSMDSLRFTTSGERPTALSILTQWNGGSTSGSVYGMGVRCTSGGFKRMFTQVAVGGSITVPDFVGGDPTVSARSAALGNVIGAGESRWYFVYYRDPVVLGGCPAANTFNATQTGKVTWSL